MNEVADVEEGVEQLLTREAVAKRLDCSIDTVSNMARDGRFLPPILIGSMKRWREGDVNAWIAARAATARKIEATAAKSVAPQKRSARRG